MTQHDAFVQAIIADPADDTPRLVMADWLEENDDVARAEFIRVQVELARLNVDDHAITFWDGQLGDGPEYYQKAKRLRRRERELLEAQGDLRDWLGPVWPVAAKYVGYRTWFRRGFVESVTLPCADFMAHAATLFRAAPITDVRLSDKQPWFEDDDEVHWNFDGVPMRWSLPPELKPYALQLERHRLPVWHGQLAAIAFRFDGHDENKTAYDALSRWLVAYGREKAELPPLPSPPL